MSPAPRFPSPRLLWPPAPEAAPPPIRTLPLAPLTLQSVPDSAPAVQPDARQRPSVQRAVQWAAVDHPGPDEGTRSVSPA